MVFSSASPLTTIVGSRSQPPGPLPSAWSWAAHASWEADAYGASVASSSPTPRTPPCSRWHCRNMALWLHPGAGVSPSPNGLTLKGLQLSFAFPQKIVWLFQFHRSLLKQDPWGSIWKPSRWSNHAWWESAGMLLLTNKRLPRPRHRSLELSSSE